ncbi:hypothetical protein [Desulfuromonas acetoxidans]|uniref:hypothetical protein n=1 Tax=Desulfuromonas acetoxidans TaxID=891 RepID=UPI002930539D|nr:hypothetical protein [Desulfuromonas acetoxidans]
MVRQKVEGNNNMVIAGDLICSDTQFENLSEVNTALDKLEKRFLQVKKNLATTKAIFNYLATFTVAAFLAFSLSIRNNSVSAFFISLVASVFLLMAGWAKRKRQASLELELDAVTFWRNKAYTEKVYLETVK